MHYFVFMTTLTFQKYFFCQRNGIIEGLTYDVCDVKWMVMNRKKYVLSLLFT